MDVFSVKKKTIIEIVTYPRNLQFSSEKHVGTFQNPDFVDLLAQ